MERLNRLSAWISSTYGEPLYKIALNAGLGCPNRDGTISSGGCIFCSAGGSGDFAPSPAMPIPEQLARAKLRIADKYRNGRYIAYFQAYTNTYASIPYLERIFNEAVSDPDVAVLSIATRPDCLGGDVLELLSGLNRKKPVWIELGLQTANDKTAEFINRGYPTALFTEAAHKLSRLRIPVIAHMILGLPDETLDDMTATADYLSSLPVSGVKLQLLHILKDTPLESVYRKSVLSDDGRFAMLDMDRYVDGVIACLEHLRPDIVIHRLTGDGPPDLLIAPDWSRHKRAVLNEIGRRFKQYKTWQGRKAAVQPPAVR